MFGNRLKIEEDKSKPAERRRRKAKGPNDEVEGSQLPDHCSLKVTIGVGRLSLFSLENGEGNGKRIGSWVHLSKSDVCRQGRSGFEKRLRML